MKIGICMFLTDYTMTPQALAQASEERGFESLWVPEHSHIPIPRVTPWGGGSNFAGARPDRGTGGEGMMVANGSNIT